MGTVIAFPGMRQGPIVTVGELGDVIDDTWDTVKERIDDAMVAEAELSRLTSIVFALASRGIQDRKMLSEAARDVYLNSIGR